MSTSFGWKRKIGSTTTKPSTSTFRGDDDDDQAEESDEIDWLTASKRSRGGALEDPSIKADRLTRDGSTLAESGRYWEAVRIWDEALSLTATTNGGDDHERAAKLHEMKSQAYLELREDFEAVRSAERAVECDRTWSVARQTLGRARLNLGEVHMALKSFCSALHLAPWSREIREDDIRWTMGILEKKEKEDRDRSEDEIRGRRV